MFSKTVLFGQRNKNRFVPKKRQRAPSIVRFLPRFSSKHKGSNLTFNTSQNDAIGAGVGTALVLANKKRRIRWTKEIRTQFPWIPPKMLSGCVESLASAFAAIAPKDLQKALRPGGLEKVRSTIEANFVRNLRAQPIIEQLPMPEDDKNKLVAYLVDLSLDFFLKDLESALAAPSLKLQDLDREQRDIRKIMSVRQRAWYRLRYRPKSTVAVGLLSMWSIGITLWVFRQNLTFIPMCTKLLWKFKSFFSFLAGSFVEVIWNTRSIILKLLKPKISWPKKPY